MPNSHAKAAKNYRPAQTSLLFVAEAPPNSIDRYFYYEDVEQGDWLWIALMKALYAKKWGQAETQRLQKRKWLKEFKDDQYRLIDAVKEPVYGNSRARIARIRQNASALTREIKSISPTRIILIKVTVYDALFQKLKDAGLPVIDARLPFPSSGRQKEFQTEFRRLVSPHITGQRR